MSEDKKSKYLPNWNQKPGKVTRTEKGIQIHPHDLIALIHKKKGLDEAGKLAVKLLSSKYERILEDSKA